MNITAGEYMHVVDDILGVLTKREIDDVTKNEVLAILWSLKGMIMGQ
jgi:hemoglobin